MGYPPLFPMGYPLLLQLDIYSLAVASPGLVGFQIWLGQ
jgi:hypothetical protein